MFNFKEKFNNIFTKIKRNSKKLFISGILSSSLLISINPAYANNIHIPESINNDINIGNINTFNIQYVSSYMEYEATGYSPEEGWNITASGHNLYDVVGFGCASNDFPLGTQIYIECPSASWINGIYTVLDRMAYSGCIDIAFNTIEECNNFGRRLIYVSVL